MNRRWSLLLLLIIFSVRLSGQIGEKQSGNYESVSTDSLYLHLIQESYDWFSFEFVNKSSDSLYLFDSYMDEVTTLFEGDLSNAKYLHRYYKKKKECKLSFLPFLPYLSVQGSDLIIMGEDKFVCKGQILYHFSLIPPKGKLNVAIPRKIFNSKKYVKDIPIESFSIFDKRIKFKDVYPKECKEVTVEFAIYKKINLLTLMDAYYCNSTNFNEQARSYEIFSINIDVE